MKKKRKEFDIMSTKNNTKTYFSPSGTKTKNEELERLNKEAHEAGMSYGKFVSQMYAPRIEKRGHIY